MTCRSDDAVIVGCASMVKLYCGVANNAAWMVALEAFDHVKKHRNYRFNVKRLYRRCFDEFRQYEHRLLHAQENRLFHVADMDEKTRKRYGNISDREYYDFWVSIGDICYQRTHPLVTSLWNKYRLSLLHHAVPEAAVLAWSMTAHACLMIASDVCECVTEAAISGTWLTKSEAWRVFGQLSLSRVAQAWNVALQATDPSVDEYKLESTEFKNIVMGLNQLRESWLSAEMLYGCTRASAEEYGEVFRTMGEQRKAMRELMELEEEVKNDT